MHSQELLNYFHQNRIADGNFFPLNDIGMAGLFYHVYQMQFCYVVETSCYYAFNGRHWVKDVKNLGIKEKSKVFALSLEQYGKEIHSEMIEKIGKGLTSLKKRESLVNDSTSINPMKFCVFDSNKYLFNCQNGTLDLETGNFRPHSPVDYITKLSNVNYNPEVCCLRWESFIGEVMQNDPDCMRFLQKTFGYALTGDTSHECFFIFYGSTTRNGKSTCCETISHLMGDYARNVQPETLSKSKKNGSNPSPDVARLQGIRLAVTPEPEKGLELNVSLMKQLTGGDKLTSRFLNENPIEFTPEFKIIMNTNHQPRISDDTVFSSHRVKLIPFERHFSEEEQDKNLKNHFREPENLSGIFNWMLQGYRLMKQEGFQQTGKLLEAVEEYREESDILGNFVRDCLSVSENNRLPTKRVYTIYDMWAKDSGYRPMSLKNLVAEMKKRYDVRRDSGGNVLIGFDFVAEYKRWFY
ncbi:MAG: phage/plasmid primase, P4 family [Eubacteriales bacterium]